jgi:hypothetical protein
VILTSTAGQPTCELGFFPQFRGGIAISHTVQNVGVRDLRAELELGTCRQHQIGRA